MQLASTRGEVQAAAREYVIRIDPTMVLGHRHKGKRVAGSAETVASWPDALRRARAIQQSVEAQDIDRGTIAIEWPPGAHDVAETMLLGPGDGGTWLHPWILRGTRTTAKQHPPTVLRGSLALVPYAGDWSALRRRLQPVARQHVIAYQMPTSLGQPRIDAPRFHPRPAPAVGFEVFDTAGALQPARWPNKAWARTRSAGLRTLAIDAQRIARWAGEQDLWIYGYLKHDWSFESLPVRKVIPGKVEIELGGTPAYGLKTGSRIYVAHALAELDAPGEWYFARDSNVLLVWPRPGKTPRGLGEAGANLRISVTSTAFQFKQARHVRVEGLAIEHFRGDAIVVDGGENISI
ncbi:MAG TPA: hypothetical protein VMX97_09490, partial [Hyphomicrobiaceae bacterium]|nr:hypothetical protein [Hyphomicrobiaceae bacterium]